MLDAAMFAENSRKIHATGGVFRSLRLLSASLLPHTEVENTWRIFSQGKIARARARGSLRDAG